MYRIGGCPSCGGTQYREPDTGEWVCMTCSYRPRIVKVVYHEVREVVRQGKIGIEILGTGVQCLRRESARHESIDSVARSRYYDTNREAMEEEYSRISEMRCRARDLPALRKAARKLAEFHEHYELDSTRWSKLRKRWGRPVTV